MSESGLSTEPDNNDRLSGIAISVQDPALQNFFSNKECESVGWCRPEVCSFNGRHLNLQAQPQRQAVCTIVTIVNSSNTNVSVANVSQVLVPVEAAISPVNLGLHYYFSFILDLRLAVGEQRRRFAALAGEREQRALALS